MIAATAGTRSRPSSSARVTRAAILEKWELEAEVIGQVTDTGRYRVFEGDRLVVDLPGEPLVEACPTYTREGIESEEVKRARAVDPLTLCASNGQSVDRWVSEGGAMAPAAETRGDASPATDRRADASSYPPHRFNRTLLRLLASPNIAS